MFSPKKRINRISYLVGLISVPVAILLGQVILGTILGLIPGFQSSLAKQKPDTLVNVFGAIAMIVYFPFLFCVVVYLLLLIKQRSNDITDKALLLSLLSLLSIVGIFVLALIPGKKQTNQYGVPPAKGTHLIR